MKLKYFLRTCLPDFWTMNNDYSESWDQALNRLMDKNSFVEITPYRAKIGGVQVWVGNYPYAAFNPDQKGFPHFIRPSRITIARAREKLLKEKGSEILVDPFDHLGRD